MIEKRPVAGAYYRFARRENPTASEEFIEERARVLEAACKANARKFAKQKWPDGDYRPI